MAFRWLSLLLQKQKPKQQQQQQQKAKLAPSNTFGAFSAQKLALENNNNNTDR